MAPQRRGSIEGTRGLAIRVWGLGFGVWALGFGGLRFRVWGLGLGALPSPNPEP